jgi:hypothetical protein
MPTFIHHHADAMPVHSHDEFRTCPHCGQRARHSIVRERVLAPVLWCLNCFHTRIGDDAECEAPPRPSRGNTRAGQPLRLAG